MPPFGPVDRIQGSDESGVLHCDGVQRVSGDDWREGDSGPAVVRPLPLAGRHVERVDPCIVSVRRVDEPVFVTESWRDVRLGTEFLCPASIARLSGEGSDRPVVTGHVHVAVAEDGESGARAEWRSPLDSAVVDGECSHPVSSHPGRDDQSLVCSDVRDAIRLDVPPWGARSCVEGPNTTVGDVNSRPDDGRITTVAIPPARLARAAVDSDDPGPDREHGRPTDDRESIAEPRDVTRHPPSLSAFEIRRDHPFEVVGQRRVDGRVDRPISEDGLDRCAISEGGDVSHRHIRIGTRLVGTRIPTSGRCRDCRPRPWGLTVDRCIAPVPVHSASILHCPTDVETAPQCDRAPGGASDTKEPSSGEELDCMPHNG